jgi:hypothetical protein
MSDNVIQTSFASGELSPSLFARVDFAKYHSGAATMRNFFVDYRSGASTRSGTEFIMPPVQGVGPVRLVRFQQSVSVTYCLVFGNGYLRFITQGGAVVQPPVAIASISAGTSTTVTLASAAYVSGDLVFIAGGNIPQLANRYFIVQAISGTTYNLLDSVTSQQVNSTGWPAYTGGAVAQRVHTISTPYLSSELALLKFSQKGSQMNITHPAHPPYVLQLFSATNWTLVPATFGASVGTPTPSSVTASATGPAYVQYKATAVDDNGQESPASAPLSADAIVDMRTTTGTVQVVVNAVAGAVAYNFYKSVTSTFGTVPDGVEVGYIGTSNSNLFLDSNIVPDFSQVPPIHKDPISVRHPQVSSYFQQRLVYANAGGEEVDRFWMSKPGAFYNFDGSNPSQSDDSVDAELVSLEVNEIKSMIPMPSGLVMLTTKGAWQVSGGAGGVATQGGPITPTSITATAQAYIGANDVPPILVNYDIMYIQQKGSIVRDLTYNIYANIYTGNDISILSSHLFYGHQIKEWAYAEEPFKMIWAIREDGIMLSLTLIKEQDMYGWARHDTFGNFESICTITEGPSDAAYVVVSRPNAVTGDFRLYIERIAERDFKFGAEDAWAVDCGLSTVHNTPNAILTASVPDSLGIATFTTPTPVFSSSMVGWIIRVGGGKAEVTQFISTTQVKAKMIQPITAVIPNDPLHRPDIGIPGTWAIDKPITVIHALDHLEGQQVAVLADGGVVNDMVVQGGSITLPAPASNVTVGLAFQAQLQTMYLDVGNEANTLQGKRKKINALTVRVKDSRGLKAGRTFQTVTPIKEMNRVTLMGLPVPLITADERIVMDPLWDVPGQICLQVDDPLPATVLGVIPEITVGDTPK